MMEILKPLLLTGFIFLVFAACVTAADYETGMTYHGFKLLKKQFVKEVNGECLLFEHEKSGAHLLKIATDDQNKTFSITFKTDPETNSGTPHIMEHSVLNGSKKFPVKSPFDVLAKGSLNTFLNAFTGNDRTSYPIASMNTKDYFNLMDVYLDAVFNPMFYKDPRILKQEGWHFELTDKDKPLIYKGVVYNEMKGSFSNPDRELDFLITKSLFPSNAYRFESGGYPTDIPKLTYEQFLGYHTKYYHPSNSFIFLYGDANLDDELKLIDEQYLNNYTSAGFETYFNIQKGFTAPKEVESTYSTPEGSPTKDQTYLAMCFVTGRNTDRKLVYALQLVTDVLIDQESASIKKALEEAGIGKDVFSTVDDLQQNVISIVVKNANPEDKEKFSSIIMEKMKEAVKNGLDKKAVDASLNRREFSLREGRTAQKGIMYSNLASTGWFFGKDPFLTLEYEKTLTALKEGIADGYLEEVVKNTFIENRHSVLITLKPEPGLETKKKAELEKELQEIKSKLSPEEIDNLVKETNELIAYQKEEDSPEALATIPLLSLKDINPKADYYEVKHKKVNEIPVLHFETFSNNIVYTRFYFDARVLPVELIPYAEILSQVIGALDTKNYSYGDFDLAVQTHTGELSTMLATFLENRDDENLMPKFAVQSKASNLKMEKMFELIGEMINETKYDDKNRLKTLLERLHSQMQSDIQGNGINYANLRLRSYYSKEGKFAELTGGLDAFRMVSSLLADYDKNSSEIFTNLKKTASLLFNPANLIVSVTCSAEDYAAFEKQLAKLNITPGTGKAVLNDWQFTYNILNEGLLAASKVQYVCQGYDFKKLGYTWSGKMRVLNQILSRDWLTTRIRIIGGAYGGFSAISPNGTLSFMSYRDPNLEKTFENYNATPEYLTKFTADGPAMTRYIIGTVARMDMPMTAAQKGNQAVKWYLEKTKYEDLQKERDEVLSCTAADISAGTKMISDMLAKKCYCVYGNESKLKEQNALFKSLIDTKSGK